VSTPGGPPPSLSGFHAVGLNRTAWLWILGGASYGLLMRVLFGLLDASSEGAMSMGFLLATPFVVGAMAVYGARQRSRSVWTMLFGPWVAVALVLLGSMITLLEGAICLAIISPLFFMMASLGGIAMGIALRLFAPRPMSMPALAVLPLLVLLGEGALPPPRDEVHEVRESVVVAATPERIWDEIVDARDIQPGELPWSLTHQIGVPRPLSGVNLATPAGEVRFSSWERGVNFRGRVVASEHARSIRWNYEFDGHSFPPGSMDEHVAIGGRFFDLRDTTFNLQPLAGGRTRLEIVAHYRLTTRIDFYARPVAELLGHDFVRTILGLYRGRSERVRGATGDAG
jgi:hypothetical protein